MRKIRPLSWMPYHRGAIYCAPACGGGCTKVAHETAVRLAAALARRLGDMWRPVITENLGWFASAVSLCGRVKVHVNAHPGHRVIYTAFLGESGPGGRWTATSHRPEAALRTVYAEARATLARLGAIISGLPPVARL